MASHCSWIKSKTPYHHLQMSAWSSSYWSHLLVSPPAHWLPTTLAFSVSWASQPHSCWGPLSWAPVRSLLLGYLGHAGSWPHSGHSSTVLWRENLLTPPAKRRAPGLPSSSHCYNTLSAWNNVVYLFACLQSGILALWEQRPPFSSLFQAQDYNSAPKCMSMGWINELKLSISCYFWSW